jgi:hypothetical protein
VIAGEACRVPASSGAAAPCHVCGVPGDAGYFDDATIQVAPASLGEEVQVAQYRLHPQYCGALLYFAQYAEPAEPPAAPVVVETPGYEWVVLCNNQPRAPYVPTSVLRNPWGYPAFPVNLRLEEGCTVRLVVRKVVAPSGKTEIPLSRIGGRLHGRYWYNPIYGGAPSRL